jgi:hypothetical protein
VDALIAGTQQAGRFRLLIALLCKMPGVSKLSAISILAEIGIDMSRFRTAAHLVAWAGLCPGQNHSAGKRKSSRLRKGAPWLKTMLVQCAWAAKRQKNSYYKAQFYRLSGRRGPQKAICAVAASANAAHNRPLVHVQASNSIMDRFHPVPPYRAADVGTSSKTNSNKRAPRTLPSLGFQSGCSEVPGSNSQPGSPTPRKYRPHCRRTWHIASLQQSSQFHSAGVRPRPVANSQ